MIQQKTILKVSDNSGAKTVRCIKVLGGFKKSVAKLGDIIVVSIQELKNNLRKNLKIRNKEVLRALIIRTKLGSKKKKSNLRTFFDENAVVLLNKQGNPIGTRIIGPIPQSLRKKKFQKFISISAGIV